MPKSKTFVDKMVARRRAKKEVPVGTKCQGACQYDTFPGTKSKMQVREYKQGMSSRLVREVVKIVFVRCDNCKRKKWVSEPDLYRARHLADQAARANGRKK